MKHRLVYQIIITPQYEKRQLAAGLADCIRESFLQCATFNHWQVHELNVLSDHIQMIVQLNAKTSVLSAIELFKRESTKKIKENFAELEEFAWGNSFWSEGYCVESVGSCDENAMKKYIKNQK